MAGKKVAAQPVEPVKNRRKKSRMYLTKDDQNGEIAESEVDELMAEGEADVAEKK